MKKFYYDKLIYPFADIVARDLKISSKYELCMLHQHEYKAFPQNESSRADQKHPCQRLFYENVHLAFSRVYRHFLQDVISPLYGVDRILYQAIPTFRINLPGGTAVAEYHRDRDYNHSIYEENYCIPLTRMFESNAIWIESKEGLEDFRPLEGNYGEFWQFDGANLLHGNVANITNYTRVSFDFRILRKNDYKASDAKSVAAARRFIVGEYWSEL